MADNERLLNQCDENVPDLDPITQDKIPPFCGDDGTPSLKRVDSRPDLSWLKDHGSDKTGIGQSANCDPMLAGKIVNDTNRTDISYQYTKAMRGCDEGVMDLFRDIVVIAEDSSVHKVPIIWATQEKAVAAVLQSNVRKDNSLVVDRIRLPILAIHSKQMSFAPNRYIYHKATDWLGWLRSDGKPGMAIKEKYERDTVFGVTRGIPVDIGYTLYVWTLYKEDMNQIVEQVVRKITPMGYIRVRGVYWEVGVKLDSIANNEQSEPGDKNIRVIKWQFEMTAQSFIPQPIIRRKSVLKTKVDLVDNINPDEITQVIARLEDAVKEFEC
jgi:hypothetical protein